MQRRSLKQARIWDDCESRANLNSQNGTPMAPRVVARGDRPTGCYDPTMLPPPSDWPRLSAALFYDDPRSAIDWLCKAFGFSVRLLVDGPNGSVAHSELEYGGAMIMVAGVPTTPLPEGQAWRGRFASPSLAGDKVTASMAIYIENVDEHCAQARAAGGEIVSEPADVDYGPDHWRDRNYGVADCEGHLWWFMQRLSGQAKS